MGETGGMNSATTTRTERMTMKDKVTAAGMGILLSLAGALVPGLALARNPYNPPMAQDGLEVRRGPLPVIDGKLDDEVYGRTEESAAFMSLGRESATVNALWEEAAERYSRLKTRFQLVTDLKTLVVAFHAQVPKGEKPQGSGKFGGKDDFVEFFVVADNGYDFTQILVDARGHALAFRHAGPGGLSTRVELDGLEAAAAETEDGFAVEFGVPLASIGIGRHEIGAVLRGNATREGPTNGGLSTWASVGPVFNNSERFGEFYWLCRTTTHQNRQREKKAAAEKLAATGKSMVFWRTNPYRAFDRGCFPDSNALLGGAHTVEIPCGTRAIAPFVASNVGTKDFVGTFEVTGDIAARLRFREVGFVELKGGALVADPIWALPEGRVLRVRPGESALVWLDVDSRDLKPGSYTANVTLHPSRSGFNYESFAFTLQVAPLVLADRDPVAWAFGMYKGTMRDLGRDYGFLGEATLPCHSFPEDASGFRELDRVIDEAVELGVPIKDQFRIFWADFRKESHWTRYATPDRTWHYFGSEYWKKEFGRRLLLLRDHLRERGFDYGQWAIWTIDEPSGDPQVEGTAAWYAVEGAKFIRSLDPKIRLWTDPTNIDPKTDKTLNDDRQDVLLQWYDILCPNYGRLLPYSEACRKYRESGKEVWTYTVLGKETVPDALRVESWNGAKEGFRGPATFYDLSRSAGDAYDSYDGGKSTVDSATIYRDARTGGVSVSRRLEAWYEGLVDKRLIHLAERLATTEAERAKVREVVWTGADRKLDFLTLRKALMKLCRTLQARRAEGR